LHSSTGQYNNIRKF